MSEIPQLPEGCGYQGYEFGAGSYPDSICFGGRLYDADDCDGNGNYYEPTDEIPCPICKPHEAIQYWAQRNQNRGSSKREAMIAAKALVENIRRNRENGTEPWKQS